MRSEGRHVFPVRRLAAERTFGGELAGVGGGRDSFDLTGATLASPREGLGDSGV